MSSTTTATAAPVPASPQKLQPAPAVTESDTAPVNDAAATTTSDQLQKLLPAAKAAVSAVHKLRFESALARLQHYLQKLRAWVWHLIEELFEEFQPWLKWIIFDAALTLVVGHLVKHAQFLRPLFEAVGWA